MASIRKMRNKWYARVVWRVNGKLKEILIPLKTSSLTTARTRIKSVNNEERDIINGIVQKLQFKDIFRWLNPDRTSKYKKLTLKVIIPEYLKTRKNLIGSKIRKGSYERDGYALKQLTRCLGDNKTVEELNYKDIEEKFIPYYLDKGYSNAGINLSMRTLKIFVTYLVREKLIPEPIKFSMLPEDDTECYINRAEINALHDAVDEKWRRLFYFYEMVGCRASDVWKGYLDGNIWKISPKETKAKHWHFHELTDELKYIWMEWNELKQPYLDKGKSEEYAVRRCYCRVSKKMWRTIKQLREDGEISDEKKLTLKSFRHTFGIINVVKTGGDIWGTSKKLNHTEIGVTQDYLDIEHYIIAQEFPELKPYLRLVDNSPKLQGELNPASANSSSPLHTPVLGSDGYKLMDAKKRFSS